MPTETITPYTQKEVLRQNKERKLWQENDTVESIYARFLIEWGELQEAIETTPDIAYLVASEIGDIFYLAIKYIDMTGSLGSDMEDKLNEALTICELTGLKPQDCVMMKVLRNEIKYFAPILNNGFRPEEAVSLTKRSYNALIGEEKFSQWYLDFAEEISH